MAVSPLLPRSPSAINAGASPRQAKSLSVRNAIPQRVKASNLANTSPETDIAEKLNEQTASKYVKGSRCLNFRSREFSLTLSREEVGRRDFRCGL